MWTFLSPSPIFWTGQYLAFFSYVRSLYPARGHSLAHPIKRKSVRTTWRQCSLRLLPEKGKRCRVLPRELMRATLIASAATWRQIWKTQVVPMIPMASSAFEGGGQRWHSNGTAMRLLAHYWFLDATDSAGATYTRWAKLTRTMYTHGCKTNRCV